MALDAETTNVGDPTCVSHDWFLFRTLLLFPNEEFHVVKRREAGAG